MDTLKFHSSQFENVTQLNSNLFDNNINPYKVKGNLQKLFSE